MTTALLLLLLILMSLCFRTVSDCVMYPNGHALIFNGGRRGITGGNIGDPDLFGVANDVFSYNPDGMARLRCLFINMFVAKLV